MRTRWSCLAATRRRAKLYFVERSQRRHVHIGAHSLASQPHFPRLYKESASSVHHVASSPSTHPPALTRSSPPSTPTLLPFLRINISNMSGKGSGKSKSGKASGDASKSQSRSAKAGLQFPVGRVHRLLKKGNYAQRVGAGAPGKSYILTLDKRRSDILLVVQSTSRQYSNTLLLRFSSLRVTRRVTTRSSVLCLVTYSLLSGTTRSTFTAFVPARLQLI